MANNNSDDWQDVPLTAGADDWQDVPVVDYEAEATLAADKKYEDTKPSAIEAGLYGVAQGGARNFLDEVTGLIGGDAAKVALQDRVKRSKDDQPAAYTVGEVGAKIATSPLAVTPLGAAGLAGADTFASQIGDDKSLGQAAKSASIDAATAGALTKIMPALSAKLGEYGDKGKDWLAGIVQKRADNQTIKALGGTQGQIQKLGDKAKDVAAMVRDEGIISPLASSKTIAERSAKFGDDLAAQTKPIYEAAENSSISTGKLLDQIDERIASLRSNPANAPIISKLKSYQEAMKEAAAPGFNPSELREFRQGVARTVNFNADAPSQIASKDMYGLLREAEMGQIQKIDPALREANEGLFRKLHLNSLTEDMAEKGAARSTANNDVGINSWLAGSIGSTVGGPVGGAIAAAGREMTRRFGPQMEGLALDKVAKVIGGSKFEPLFAKAAERGPQAIVALHQALRSNPEYSALVGE